ncbi:MAG: hypothetical protein ACTSQY_00570 [Candidatus Odinarchaeia archaeon]|nr:MAG: hypothetical protein [Lokiarchaeota virus Fenrir Meg22_1012]URC17295.1 MAG: hypothetical protein [Lokiarchaeota virus Fenrir Meg22_1214]
MRCSGCYKQVRKVYPIKHSKDKLCSNCLFLFKMGMNYFDGFPTALLLHKINKITIGLESLGWYSQKPIRCFVCDDIRPNCTLFYYEDKLFDQPIHTYSWICKKCGEFILELRRFHLTCKKFRNFNSASTMFLRYLASHKKRRDNPNRNKKGLSHF